ncbi:hypothetical protein [Paraburkholderia nemoris]|uniref:hypothetical protein n=1 Tax=Paraburkholderia nemoris TaxID=2793076 RepID=UPI001B8C2C02|nr:hypothetical protein [Paraburkholderia nemoris]
MTAAFTVNVSVRFEVMSAAFAVLVTIGVFVRVVRAMRLMVMTAAFAPTMPIGIFIRMPVDMPVMPVGTGFGPFRAVRFGEVGVRHGWLPGSICGLVNTLKPLQGQGRIPEGP